MTKVIRTWAPLAISLLALFVASGGVSWAASVISGKRIKKNSIPLNRLTKSARKALAGKQGPPGVPGTNGKNGTNGATNVVVRSVSGPVSAGGSSGTIVPCNPGERATGGGASFPAFLTSPLFVVNLTGPATNGAPSTNGETPNGWISSITNNTGSSQNATFYVDCASP